MDISFIWGPLGPREQLGVLGTWWEGLLNLLCTLMHIAWRFRWVRNERRGKGKAMEWILSLGKEARTRIWGLGAGNKGTLHVLSLSKVTAWRQLPQAPWPGPAPGPDTWPSSSINFLQNWGGWGCGEWWHPLPPGPLPTRIGHLACPEVPARVRRSCSQGPGWGENCALLCYPDTLSDSWSSHEVANLGLIVVYLTFLPVSLVWLSCQLSRLLQSPVWVSPAQLPVTSAYGGHCGQSKTSLMLHSEDRQENSTGMQAANCLAAPRPACVWSG